jgi:hypothetical protein
MFYYKGWFFLKENTNIPFVIVKILTGQTWAEFSTLEAMFIE